MLRLHRAFYVVATVVFVGFFNLDTSSALSSPGSYSVSQEFAAPSHVTPETQGRMFKGRVGFSQSRRVQFTHVDDTGPNPVVSNTRLTGTEMGISPVDFSIGAFEWADLLIKMDGGTMGGFKFKVFGPSYDDRRYKIDGTPFSLSVYGLFGEKSDSGGSSSYQWFSTATESRKWSLRTTQEVLGFSAGQRLTDDFLLYLNYYNSQFRSKGSLEKIDSSINVNATYNYGLSGSINGLYIGGEYDFFGTTQLVLGAVLGYSNWAFEVGGNKSYADAGINLAWNW